MGKGLTERKDGGGDRHEADKDEVGQQVAVVAEALHGVPQLRRHELAEEGSGVDHPVEGVEEPEGARGREQVSMGESWREYQIG